MSTKSIINRSPVDIIIPTLDNIGQLLECIQSILATRHQYPVHIIVVNNGAVDIDFSCERSGIRRETITVVNAEHNLGWTGGIIEGLKHSTAEYVMFANDDIYVPCGSHRWLSQMVRHLVIRPWLGAVGPCSNVVMGAQNIFAKDPYICTVVPFLIGFCILLRRSTLDEIGGVDPAFNTGDDIDLSIRLRKAGYMMLVDRSVFVYHHGFQTGEKVHGKPSVPGGWNSPKMTEDTNIHLIKKHGFMTYWQFATGRMPESSRWPDERSNETEAVRKYVNGCEPNRIVDLGCGGSKTIPGSIGVDLIARGEPVNNTAFNSDADVQADIEKPMPFEDGAFKTVIARQSLEHCTDVIGALTEWKRIMSDDGTLIVAVPDERKADTIIMNPEHVHAFTPESLTRIVELAGFEVFARDDLAVGDSFVMAMHKRANG